MFIRGSAPLISPIRRLFHPVEGSAASPARAVARGGKPARKRVKLYAMAHSAGEAEQAVRDGAEGIGLARTEIMYKTPERSGWLLQALLARTTTEREPALKNLEEATRGEVAGMLKVLNGKPLTVRLLDPSLSEILPPEKFHEGNPLLGLRGVRLGIVYPDIYAMQIRGILRGAADAMRRGFPVKLGVLVPNISDPGEVAAEKRAFEAVKRETEKRENTRIPCRFGIMLETPRACVLADKLSPMVNFFTIGCNDLTQSTWALSREDAEGKFLATYLNQGIIRQDPFQHLDADGVGSLIKEGIAKGKSANPNLEIVLAGDAAGDPQTAKLLNGFGVDAVASNVKNLKAVGRALAACGTDSTSSKERTG